MRASVLLLMASAPALSAAAVAAASSSRLRALQGGSSAPTPSPSPFVDVYISPTKSPLSHAEYEEEQHEQGIPLTFVYASFFGALTASLIALYNISKHLLNYNNPVLQKTIIRILFIVPNFAIFSWLGLAFPSKSVVFESVRDIYEAFVCVFLRVRAYGGC